MTLAHPQALWLFPAAVAVLLLLQLYYSRRREVLAGSLLLWRRVAAQEHAPPRARLELSAAFWLQMAVLAALVLALAEPQVRVGEPPARRIAVLLDNGPAARARTPGGALVWDDVLAAARHTLEQLPESDRVALLASAPFPRRLDAGAGLSPAEAERLAAELVPALSGPPAIETWRAARELAAAFAGAEQIPALAVFSACAAPAEAATARGAVLWHTAGPGPGLENVALCAFGSQVIAAAPDRPSEIEVLVQVRNFSARACAGKVVLEAGRSDAPAGTDPFTSSASRREQRVALAPSAVAGVAFRLSDGARPPLRLAWQADGGARDAHPEDDAVVALPRPAVERPRVRFHGSAPHLEDLFRLSGEADVLAAEDASSATPPDLEVYVRRVPETEDASAPARLILAPPQSFADFEVQPGPLERPQTRLAESDPLTRGLQESGAGLGFPIARAARLAPAGELKVLLQNENGAVLAGRFRLRSSRPGWVLAFVPGEDWGWPRERKLDHPGLAAFLIRLLRDAAGTREPYVLTPAAALERAAGQALPLDWKPEQELVRKRGAGVLDPRSSALDLGRPAEYGPGWASALPVNRPATLALWPYLVALAAALLVAERHLQRGARAARLAGVAGTENPQPRTAQPGV